MSEGNPEFKRWLALYFIDKGNWKLTDKAIEEFGQDAIPKQTMEFAEVYSDREREERTEYRVGLTAKEKKRIAHMKIADMIDEGKAEELYDGEYITNGGKLSWKDRNVRVTVVKKLVELLDKDPRDLTYRDFIKNRLSGLFPLYEGSPYNAIKEAFPKKDIKLWEMARTPRRFYNSKKNRVAAVKWLVKKLKKDPRDLIGEDFNKNRLGGLIDYYGGSPYKAVKEAFPELGIKPWEMAMTPMGFYDTKENRIAAVKWLIERLGKKPRDLTQDDFCKNRLKGLLAKCNGSPYEAVKEAGLVAEADESYMRTTLPLKHRNIPSSKEAREAARKIERNAEKKLPKRMVKGRMAPRTS